MRELDVIAMIIIAGGIVVFVWTWIYTRREKKRKP
jgi:hypothetical protein